MAVELEGVAGVEAMDLTKLGVGEEVDLVTAVESWVERGEAGAEVVD
jgi:hypothetical protein